MNCFSSLTQIWVTHSITVHRTSNLSYRKSARFHGQTTAVTGDSSKAVDGRPEPSCTDVAFSSGTTAQWSVDLGYQYKIVNITIHFSTVSYKYRNDFIIRVSTTDPYSDPDVGCIKINSDTIPPPTYTISCPDKTIGRYVYFSRLPQGYEPNRMVLCEMIVISYKQIVNGPVAPAGKQLLIFSMLKTIIILLLSTNFIEKNRVYDAPSTGDGQSHSQGTRYKIMNKRSDVEETKKSKSVKQWFWRLEKKCSDDYVEGQEYGRSRSDMLEKYLF
ncbi:hypothetical protein LSH36_1781g00008 [Paralvinella palmiformis]|uniref:Fucolectin tachylectin-4 pentraxin-1 domain-containing protein n=1 Tax=Paralvinella palmiformis TaxID=53620 RepID=A0AAD9IRQ1_9ANNE|nr:hypothetical protein LSH36_1781g00008 [Paralvinella palmiformis]